jgi:hypothetical protein
MTQLKQKKLTMPLKYEIISIRETIGLDNKSAQKGGETQ